MWPQAITPDYFQKHHGGKIPPGVLRSVVPAAPDAWITALERFGTMSFGEVAAAAIRFARDGFPMYPLMSRVHHGQPVRRTSAGRRTRRCSCRRGGRREPGEVFVQSELASTLQYLADVEKANRRKGRAAALRAARDAFYKGDIAAAIVKFHRKNGGLMRMEDFADFSIKFEPTVKAQFNGIDVHACGPWSQGPVLPMALNILKGYDLQAMGHNSPQYIHVMTEALKLAFADRHHHFGDPDFVKVPIKGLMSEAYAAHRRGLITRRPRMAGDAAGGRSGDAGRIAAPLDAAAAVRRGAGARRHDLSVLRRSPRQCVFGDAVRRLEQFADHSGRRHPVLGPRHAVVVGSDASEFGRAGQAPAADAESRRSRSRTARCYMPFGTPGGDVQPQAMLQVFLNVNVFGMDRAERDRGAARSPTTAIRVRSSRTTIFRAGSTSNRAFRKRPATHWRSSATRSTGGTTGRWLAGAPCTIVVDHKTGVRHGGADPRRPAYALGW